MKKIYLTLLLLAGYFGVEAQRSIGTTIQINMPTTDYYVKVKEFVKPDYTITNTGPDPIRPGDTILFQDPRCVPGTYKKFWYTVPIAAGQSVQLNEIVLGGKPYWWVEYDTSYPAGYSGIRMETLYECKDSKIESATGRKVYRRPFKDSTKFAWFAEIVDIVTPKDSGTIIYTSHGLGLSLDTVHIWINGYPLGIMDFFANSKQAIDVYPNPASNSISFEYNATEAGNKARVQIMDALGRTVLQPQLDPYAYGMRKNEVDISSLQPGIYFLKLDGDHNTWMSRFIVRK